MVNIIVIDSIDKLVELFKQDRNTKINRLRSPYLFRGLSDEKYHLVPSLFRNCKSESHKLELQLLNSFSKYAKSEYPRGEDAIWDTMIIGQHHGLPTRLLDWTRSPLIALHFAETESNLDDLDKHNCVVWKVDIKELNGLLPSKYQDFLHRNKKAVFTVDDLLKLSYTLEEYDNDMNGKSFLMLEPPSVDQRIINQFSFFSVIPYGMAELDKFLETNTHNTVKYIIDKSIRWDIRDILDQQNINERMIYPGLDGISKWLLRRYYVRNS